ASIEDWAKWLAFEIGDLGSPTVVGHSMGSLIALETAVAHPGSVGRLLLVGAAAELAVHADPIAAAEVDLAPAAAVIAARSPPPRRRCRCIPISSPPRKRTCRGRQP